MNYKDAYRKVTRQAAPICLVLQASVLVAMVRLFKGHDRDGFHLGPLVIVTNRADVPAVIKQMVHVSQFWQRPLTYWHKKREGRKDLGLQGCPFEQEARSFEKRAVLKWHAGEIG